MTFATYISKEEKERQDREKVEECERIFKIENERYIKKEKESDKELRISRLIPWLVFGLLGTTVSIINKNAPHQTKSNGIEATINQEYQNDKSKLDSAYNFMKNKADSLYNAKKDSLQKVYENKLEKELK